MDRRVEKSVMQNSDKKQPVDSGMLSWFNLKTICISPLEALPVRRRGIVPPRIQRPMSGIIRGMRVNAVSFTTLSAILLSAMLPAQAQNLLTGPNTVVFTATAGGANPPPQTVVVNHTGATPRPYVVNVGTSNGGNWLSASVSTGVTPSRFTLTATSSGLGQGLYSGTVIINSTGLPPARVDVTLNVTSTPQLTSSVNTLSFFRNTTADITTEEQLLVVSSTGSPINFNLATTTSDGGSWLIVASNPATTPGVVSARVNASGLAPGNYNGTIAISAQGLNTINVPVTLVVSANPFLTLGSTSLNLTAVRNGPAVTQSVPIQSSGGPVPFSASASSVGNWLIASPLNGTAPGNLDISANPAGLPSGTYSGTVQISAPGAANATISLPVNLVVTELPVISASQRSFTFDFPDATLPGNRLIRDLPAISVTASAANVIYSVSATTVNGGPWLTVGPGSATAPSDIGANIDATGLAPGTYVGAITITGPGNSVVIPVRIRVNSNAQVTVDPGTVTFNFQKGQTLPSNQVVNIKSTGAAFSYQTSVTAITPAGSTWLTGAASTSTTPGTLTLGINQAVAATLANGQYTATVSVAGQMGITPPIATPPTVNVVLNVSESPQFNVSPTSLDVVVPLGGPAPAQRSIAITATDNSSRAYTATATTTTGGTWLLVGPNAGNTPQNLSVSVLPGSLGVGVYEGTIQVTVPSISATPQSVRVRLIIQAGNSVSVSATSLAFTQVSGGAAPAARSINLNSVPAAVSFQVTTSTNGGGSWLIVSPNGGTTPSTLSVAVSGASLAAGIYTGSIGISSGDVGSDPVTIPVTLTVTSPGLTLTPPSISLFATPGSVTPVTQQFSVAAGGATAAFTVVATTQSGGGWLTVSANSGTAPASLTITGNPSGLSAGTYTGTITVTAPGVNNSPQTLPVTFTIATAPPAGRQLLAQIADGAGWKSTITLVNLDRDPAPFTLSFRAGDGTPLRVPVDGSPGRLESIQDVIPVGGSRIIQTLGTDGTLSQGWADMTSTKLISGLAVFRQTVTGRPDQEAAVLATSPVSRFLLPYDNTQGFVSSMALVNTNATQSRGTTITPRDEAGVALPGNTINLPPLGHNAFVMSERIPSIAGRRGVADFSSSGSDFSALGLRFNPGGSFTSLPVLTPTTGVPPATQVISQIADGSAWKSTITLVNLDAVPAAFTLRFWRQNGTALLMPLAGAPAADTITGTIPVGGTRIIETAGGNTDLVQGWAELSATANVGGLAVFRQRVNNNDQEAAVSLTATSTRFTMPFDNLNSFVTAMAIVNSSATLGATINVTFRDENGQQIGTGTISLPGRGYSPFALTDQFPIIRNRRGVAEFSSPGTQITGLGLRFNPGGAFTSFPVLPQ